jgi:hypothetical protein
MGAVINDMSPLHGKSYSHGCPQPTGIRREARRHSPDKSKTRRRADRDVLSGFTVGASVRSGSALAPVAIGAVLMAMIYASGHISGGHVNPAVTMAALVRGRIGLGEAVGYWFVQFVAGVLAALAVGAVVSSGEAATLSLSGQLTAGAAAGLAFRTLNPDDK